MTAASARVLVADADAPTRVGLRLALPSPRFEIVAEAESATSALAAARDLEVDVAVVATDLPGGGLDAVRMIGGAHRGVCIVVLTDHPHEDELLAAVLAGAVGYLAKSVDPARLPAVLEGVLAGEVALPRQLTRRLLQEVRGRDAHRSRVSDLASAPLSAREWEVLHLLAAERSTGEIARWLGISDVTVRRHASSVVAKLGVPDRKSAVRLLRSAE